ncbi:MAG: superoxide dismutase [Acidimicrobiia bacterium]|nr:superoxide dismutase [Acidimicrobiia bacterium]MYC58150.1 superoxide dismutase [Acidimicrobiia bacterium]MYG94363.1 superoxide dismutase [Acidimicrobiia bacterium]MYI30582.1 superoxide dismutase [Acidimicrobiia bacterium]
MSFELPPLPYNHSALEPYISANTLNFHYDRHHAGYVNNLNRLATDTEWENAELVQVITSANGPIFNNAAQIWNHTFYWGSMSPGGGGAPSGSIASAIENSFGSYDEFRNQFAAAATSLFGSGWTWLVANENDGLEIMSTTNADLPLLHSRKPLLVTDVWEHAYYLDYQNARPAYVEAFLDHLINWEFATQNLASS